MNEKEIDKIIDRAIKRNNDQNAVVIEDMQSNFKMFGEALSGVSDQLKRVEKKGDATFEELGKVKIEMGVIREDVSVLKKDVSEIKTEMKVMNGRIDNIEEEVRSLRRDFDLIKDSLDPEKAKDYEERIMRIEKHLELAV